MKYLNKYLLKFYQRAKRMCFVDFVDNEYRAAHKRQSGINFVRHIIQSMLCLAKFLGIGLGNFYASKFRSKFVFIRLNLDHFGPIVNLYLFWRSADFDPQKIYVVLSLNFKNSLLLKMFPKNFIFLDGIFFFVLLRGLFFSKMSRGLVGGLRLSQTLNDDCFDFHNFTFAKEDLDPIQLPENMARSSEIRHLKERIKRKQFVAIYCRTPGWSQSAQMSARNQSPDDFVPLIEGCLASDVCVVRFGGQYQPAVDFSHPNFVDTTQMVDSHERDLWIWKHCCCVIGSISGATHVPSVMFRKPTLYIGSHSLAHHALYHGLRHHPGVIPSWINWAQASDGELNDLEIHLRDTTLWEDLLPSFRTLKPAELREAGGWFITQHVRSIKWSTDVVPSNEKLHFRLRSTGEKYSAKCFAEIKQDGNNVIFCSG